MWQQKKQRSDLQPLCGVTHWAGWRYVTASRYCSSSFPGHECVFYKLGYYSIGITQLTIRTLHQDTSLLGLHYQDTTLFGLHYQDTTTSPLSNITEVPLRIFLIPTHSPCGGVEGQSSRPTELRLTCLNKDHPYVGLNVHYPYFGRPIVRPVYLI